MHKAARARRGAGMTRAAYTPSGVAVTEQRFGLSALTADQIAPAGNAHIGWRKCACDRFSLMPLGMRSWRSWSAVVLDRARAASLPRWRARQHSPRPM